MMGKVYMSASNVIAWLGPSTDESDILFHWIKNHAGLAMDASEGRSIYKIKLSFPNAILRALHLLLKRASFHRVWITQEAVLNRQVLLVCGN